MRFAAIQWVGEERLTELRKPLVAAISVGPATARLFGGYLAALERLDGVTRIPSNEWAGEEYIVRALEDPKSSPEVLRWSLRMLRSDHPLLTLDRLRSYLRGDDAALRIEAVRSLRESPLAGRDALLLEVAASDAFSAAVRAEAVMGLSPDDVAARKLLITLATGDNAVLRDEALRSLRGTTLSDPERARLAEVGGDDPAVAALVSRVLKPPPDATATASQDVDAWLSALRGSGEKIEGDADAGQRIFFHTRSAGCAKCHQFAGRGARVGPELTTTAAALDERRLVESIVNPDKEIAPQFVSWAVVPASGQPLVGMLVHLEATGEQTYVDKEGHTTRFEAGEVESRRPLSTSIMPSGLSGQMTLEEFRNLVAFLRSAGAADRGHESRLPTGDCRELDWRPAVICYGPFGPPECPPKSSRARCQTAARWDCHISILIERSS